MHLRLVHIATFRAINFQQYNPFGGRASIFFHQQIKTNETTTKSVQTERIGDGSERIAPGLSYSCSTFIFTSERMAEAGVRREFNYNTSIYCTSVFVCRMDPFNLHLLTLRDEWGEFGH